MNSDTHTVTERATKPLRVKVEPSLYSWAAERSRLDVEQLSDRFPKLSEWMAGHGSPTLKQVEGFARATGTAVGYFFLPGPPDEHLPIPDFRTVGDRPVARPSGNLLDTIYQCQQRQDWYRDYVRSSGMGELEWAGSLQPNTAPEDAAQQMRSALSFDMQQRGANYQQAFTVLRQRAEELGVMVMVSGVVGSNTRRKLDPQEFRGFALADRFAPLVFVNGSDTRAAQIFTLAHELAHIWTGESALDSVDLGARATNDIEGWCNRVAAETLVPLEEIRAEFNPRVGISTELQRLARRFKTSRLVVLRRLHECEFLTWDEYQQTFQTEYDQALERASGSGGDFYNTQPARVGTVFAQTVIASTLEGDTSYTDAFQLLGFKKTSTFHELADRLGVT
ncbi:MAG: ImmA/IrrE family metallo-endopeptidase [Acidimicrobiia bacterium]|nr:ImmA/IrrE family metallo-endopeptidase [Acidimicrobiia bacterium]MCY4458187.1 ImmA/IrrE family metallo-endopeptidase [Acidimicrobiaceae bacterium]